jgi:hypothetical protein
MFVSRAALQKEFFSIEAACVNVGKACIRWARAVRDAT